MSATLVNTFMMDVEEIMKCYSADAGWYADQIACEQCDTSFYYNDIQYLGEGKYRATCWNDNCNNFLDFDNYDIIIIKRGDEHYWMVKELVRYHKENNIPMVIASVNSDKICDGHHRLSACMELGYEMVIVDDNYGAVYDEPEDWARNSPAFIETEDGEFMSVREVQAHGAFAH